MAPKGWKLTYEGGKRRAINPEGEEVAYNQYLNAQAQRSGFKNHSDYRKHAVEVAGHRTKENRAQLALGSKGLKVYKKTFLDRKRTSAYDRRPGGKMARVLEDLGLRPVGATYPVGDTP